jgi:hypothetical protein
MGLQRSSDKKRKGSPFGVGNIASHLQRYVYLVPSAKWSDHMTFLHASSLNRNI